MRLKDQAVLFRTSSHAVQIEVELTRRNVPYVKFGGLKFLDSAHVKDLLSILRLARNPRDRVAGSPEDKKTQKARGRKIFSFVLAGKNAERLRSGRPISLPVALFAWSGNADNGCLLVSEWDAAVPCDREGRAA
jgi:hypothetical protein